MASARFSNAGSRPSADRSGRQPRLSAITKVRPVPVNSQGAEVPSVTPMPSAAEKLSGAVISWAHTAAARKVSGGHITT
jgi:hypothetical protein